MRVRALRTKREETQVSLLFYRVLAQDAKKCGTALLLSGASISDVATSCRHKPKGRLPGYARNDALIRLLFQKPQNPLQPPRSDYIHQFLQIPQARFSSNEHI